MELAIVGDSLFVLGFRLAGVRKTFIVDQGQSVSDAVRAVLKDPDAGILVMETRDVQKLDSGLRRDLEASVRPTLVAIGTDEDTGLREKLKQAVGVDLWK
jgi:V/A-type H+-transporting ATPase subunit F